MSMAQFAIRMTKFVAPLCLLSAPIFIGFGAWMLKPEFAVGGVALIVYAVVALKQSKRLAAEAELQGPR